MQYGLASREKCKITIMTRERNIIIIIIPLLVTIHDLVSRDPAHALIITAVKTNIDKAGALCVYTS